ncbi:integrase [Oxalicibacterium solurbis]|uniref:Integrase n=2 Tax=Oxalicibacterium solurbis TaxID=69280 RepID=A0A8J3F556_9BURK|nr:integrase [Oxalicibacterium solurbis]
MDNEKLENTLFLNAALPNSSDKKPIIDFPKVHTELQKKGATLAILHQEWQETVPPHNHISYSQYCRLYNLFKKTLQVSMRQTAVFGEVAFVDYSGKTLCVTDPDTGELKKVQIFVGVLGGSKYTFCEATWSQTSKDWIASHTRMFEFFGGVPRIIVPDNLKAAVIKADRFDPTINESYSAMCRYYGTHPFPARPREPKDKSKAEAAVLLTQRWILFSLRSRKFFSLAEMNREIGILLEKLNIRPFQNLPGSRFSTWLELERPTLMPLPTQRYEFAEWGKVRAGQDYHVCVDRHFYSVPYHLKGMEFEYCLSGHSLDLLYRGNCLVTHVRSFAAEQTTTLNEHRHPTHLALLQWSESEALAWATDVGPNTAVLLQAQLAKIRGYLLGYRITQAMKNLFKSYGKTRLEEACSYAVKNNITGTQELRNILSRNIDRLLAQDVPEESKDTPHQNIRGANYYSDFLQITDKEMKS